MSIDYFGRARAEVIPCLPSGARRVLELGCGNGATLEAVKECLGAPDGMWLAGVELNSAMAAVAHRIADRVWVGNAEELDFADEIEPKSLDAILCLDVLEHLVDPWKTVRRLSTLLKPGGRLIASIPNVRHWKFIWNLLFKADFRYRDSGLLDRTHLRFFVKSTACELVTCGGLRLYAALPSRPFMPMDVRWLLQKVTANRLEELLVKQYLYVAEAE